MSAQFHVRCCDCGKYVRVKPVFGTLHVCLTDDEIEARRRVQPRRKPMK